MLCEDPMDLIDFKTDEFDRRVIPFGGMTTVILKNGVTVDITESFIDTLPNVINGVNHDGEYERFDLNDVEELISEGYINNGSNIHTIKDFVDNSHVVFTKIPRRD